MVGGPCLCTVLAVIEPQEWRRRLVFEKWIEEACCWHKNNVWEVSNRSKKGWSCQEREVGDERRLRPGSTPRPDATSERVKEGRSGFSLLVEHKPHQREVLGSLPANALTHESTRHVHRWPGAVQGVIDAVAPPDPSRLFLLLNVALLRRSAGSLVLYSPWPCPRIVVLFAANPFRPYFISLFSIVCHFRATEEFTRVPSEWSWLIQDSYLSSYLLYIFALCIHLCLYVVHFLLYSLLIVVWNALKDDSINYLSANIVWNDWGELRHHFLYSHFLFNRLISIVGYWCREECYPRVDTNIQIALMCLLISEKATHLRAHNGDDDLGTMFNFRNHRSTFTASLWHLIAIDDGSGTHRWWRDHVGPNQGGHLLRSQQRRRRRRWRFRGTSRGRRRLQGFQSRTDGQKRNWLANVYLAPRLSWLRASRHLDANFFTRSRNQPERRDDSQGTVTMK